MPASLTSFFTIMIGLCRIPPGTSSIGIITAEDDGFQELRKADPTNGVYQKLVLHGGRIVGAILMGAKERVPIVSSLIKEGIDVSRYADRLLDDQFDLSDALQQGDGEIDT